MPEKAWGFIVVVLYTYALLGAVFGIAFVTAGVQRVDRAAKGSSLGFRLLIFPGTVAFWPLMLERWISDRTSPPEQRNPNR